MRIHKFLNFSVFEICNILFVFRHTELKEAMPGQQSKYASAEKLDTLLRKMCGEGVGNALSALRSKWDSFDILMESHQEVIKGQVINCLNKLTISDQQ